MLRRMCGLTRLDRIRNEVIRNMVSVVDIGGKNEGVESQMVWARADETAHGTSTEIPRH